MTPRSTTLLLLSSAVLISWALLNGAVAEERITTPASCQETAAVVPVSASSTVADPRAPATREEVMLLKAKSLDLIAQGDIAGARMVLTRASSGGDACALFALAETYDPTRFQAWGVLGTRSDAGRAAALYQRALSAGIVEGQARLDRLR